MLYLVGSAAPPVRDLGTVITRLQHVGWTVCLFVTPTAATWIDVEALTVHTGFPVRDGRRREDSLDLPDPDLVLACPVTFNTINKWTSGVSDNSALGILNETFGFEVGTYVMPYVKSTLAAHPAFANSLSALAEWGVEVLPNELVRPAERTDPFLWERLVSALPEPGDAHLAIGPENPRIDGHGRGQ
ncbi:flavoprotein [Amycolatopsis japonica]|uniref:flavoprotein n=1 Tax=Amycolatopsis japonica TaxID=208439 RepID=UPI00378B141C